MDITYLIVDLMTDSVGLIMGLLLVFLNLKTRKNSLENLPKWYLDRVLAGVILFTASFILGISHYFGENELLESFHHILLIISTAIFFWASSDLREEIKH